MRSYSQWKLAFDEALRNHPEISVFLHTASPVSLNSSDIENELLLPALNGVKNVLSAIRTYGPQIKHLVITSSSAANYDPARDKDPTYIMYEDTWSPITWDQAKANPVLGYYGSKKFSEQAAWDFNERENPSYTLNTVNPVWVFGPQAFDEEIKKVLNFSAEVTNQLLNMGPDSKIPTINGAFVDVRDVAKAHLAAFETGFSNKRLLLRTGSFSVQNLLDLINENFEELRGKIPTGSPGSYPDGPSCSYNNERTRKLLNFSWVDLRTSTVEAVTQILEKRN